MIDEEMDLLESETPEDLDSLWSFIERLIHRALTERDV